MRQVIFDEEFRFSPDGSSVITYPPSPEAVEVSDRCAEIALGIGRAHAPAAELSRPDITPAPDLDAPETPPTNPRKRAKETT